MIRNNNIETTGLSVYEYDANTLEELLCQFYTNIESCLEVSEESNNFLQWLKNEGLPYEVDKLLHELIKDGTIEDIINKELFTELHNKITKNSNDIKDNKSELTDNLNNVNTSLLEKINEINDKLLDKINENKSDINMSNEEILTNSLNINRNKLAIEKHGNELTLQKKLELSDKYLTCNNGDNYRLNTLFRFDNQNNTQSICCVDGYIYVGFDMNNGGIIRKYNLNGTLIKETSLLQIGHVAGLTYNTKERLFYVVNGGGSSPTKVYKINFDESNIIATYDFSKLGYCGLIAYNQNDNSYILHTGNNDEGEKTFTILDSEMNQRGGFKLSNHGTPQGLLIEDELIYYLTNNKIMIMDLNGYVLKSCYHQTDKAEPQGLALGKINGVYSLLCAKSYYNNDNNFGGVYLINNKNVNNNLLMENRYSRQDNTNLELRPVMINFGVRLLDGWQEMNWGDYISGGKDVIEWIDSQFFSDMGQYELRIKLKTTLESIANVIVSPEQTLFKQSDIKFYGQTKGDGKIIVIRFLKDGESSYYDPNKLTHGSGLLITVIGGVKI
ncbi:MAG: hypothetical protein ACRCX2_33410 [Paraclostridium sp.]